MDEEVHARRWRILALLCVVQFMLFVDDTMVNVALPTIQADLGFTRTGLAWVVNAYVIVFGGCLLLGGRLADLAGRRRIFAIGLSLFAVASLTNAIAQSPEMLIVSRAVQGLGAALAAPASLSIAAVVFTDRAERAKSFALLSSLGGMGAAAGVVLSGVITDLIDWRWIFYINLPIAAVALVLTFRMIRLPQETRLSQLDVPGAATVTAGVGVLVYTLLLAEDHGWLSGRTLVGLAVAAALLGAFVAIERRSERPLVPFTYFAHARRTTGIGLHYVIAAVLFGTFFLVTLYMQRVLGYSPLEGGLAWLAFFGGLFPGFVSAPALVPRLGARAMLVTGFLLAAAGALWFSRLGPGGSYLADLVPGMVVMGFGLGWAYIAVTVAVVYDVSDEEAGLTAGMLNTGQQVGGALGLAVLVALAADGGDDAAHVVAAGLCVAAAAIAFRWIGDLRPERMPELVPAETPAGA